MSGMAMMTPAVWTPGYAVLMFFMWWIMMVAMMLPSAAPMILLFATINRRQYETGRPHVATSIFAAGYLVVWAGFSLVAVTLQWAFERADILSPALAGTSVIFGSVLLLAAGTYQLTPIKHACLRHCRSPLAFLSTHWRRNASGALRMGLVHGAFCVGCCWFLMGLLFFGGVMNLYWIAGIALFILFEKTVPAGHWLGYAAGIALLVWGAWILALAI
jgi:predicted metal-binding membrane protein